MLKHFNTGIERKRTTRVAAHGTGATTACAERTATATAQEKPAEEREPLGMPDL